VQTNKLLHVSAYFKAALSAPFTEADTRQFQMHTDVSDDAFALLMRWVYTASIQGSVNFTVGMTGPEIFPEPELNIALLVETWILGDYFGMASLFFFLTLLSQTGLNPSPPFILHFRPQLLILRVPFTARPPEPSH